MQLRYVLPVFVLAASAILPAHASLIITPTFDDSINNDSNAAEIKGAINQAISFFESNYANPITVTILFQENTDSLGSSQVGFSLVTNYQTFYNALVATNANPAAIAGLTANGGNAMANPVNGTNFINVKSANLRAVGLAGAPQCNVIGAVGDRSCDPNNAGGVNAIDGIIGLDTSETSPPGSESSDYDLVAVTEHEIDEVLGLGSAINNCDPNDMMNPCANPTASANPKPEDLFRYTAKNTFAPIGGLMCDSLTPAYLSYSGAVSLTGLNTACNGGDWGDFIGGVQVQNANGTPNQLIPYGANEFAAMSAIGYIAPEPGTWALMISAIGVVAWKKRRRV